MGDLWRGRALVVEATTTVAVVLALCLVQTKKTATGTAGLGHRFELEEKMGQSWDCPLRPVDLFFLFSFLYCFLLLFIETKIL